MGVHGGGAVEEALGIEGGGVGEGARLEVRDVRLGLERRTGGQLRTNAHTLDGMDAWAGAQLRTDAGVQPSSA